MSKIVASKGVGKNRGTCNRFFPDKALIYADRIERIVADEFPAPVVWHVYKMSKEIFGCPPYTTLFYGLAPRIPIVITRTIRPRQIEG